MPSPFARLYTPHPLHAARLRMAAARRAAPFDPILLHPGRPDDDLGDLPREVPVQQRPAETPPPSRPTEIEQPGPSEIEQPRPGELPRRGSASARPTLNA